MEINLQITLQAKARMQCETSRSVTLDANIDA